MKAQETMHFFFKCMGIGIIISALKTNSSTVTMLDMIKNLLLDFQHNIIAGIWFGLSSLMGAHLFHVIKKKLGNEEYLVR